MKYICNRVNNRQKHCGQRVYLQRVMEMVCTMRNNTHQSLMKTAQRNTYYNNDLLKIIGPIYIYILCVSVCACVCVRI